MTTYELWDDIPNGVTVYAPGHELLVIKLSSTTLVSPAEYYGRSGWIQTTGRLRGPFEAEGIVTKSAPRQWYLLGDVPKGVQVRDNVGDRWKRKKGVWYYKEADTWYSITTIYDVGAFSPFTEIVK